MNIKGIIKAIKDTVTGKCNFPVTITKAIYDTDSGNTQHAINTEYNNRIKTLEDDRTTSSSGYDFNMLPGMDIARSAVKWTNYAEDARGDYDQFPTLLHITDVHGDEVRFKNAIKIAGLLNADCVVNTGDSVKHRYSSTDEGENIEFIKKNLTNDQKKKYIHCIGNHDTWSASGGNISTSQHKSIYMDFLAVGGIILGDGAYGYKDITNKKLRIIFVDQYENNGTTISQDQIDFFCTALNSTPEEYGIVVLMHENERQAEFNEDNEDYNKFFDKERSGKAWTSSSMYFSSSPKDSVFVKIVDNFISNSTYKGISLTPKRKVEFIAFLSGHRHNDLIYYLPDTTNKILQMCCQQTCVWYGEKATLGSQGGAFNENNSFGRQEGTPNENAVNFYVIDRDKGVIKVVRIGSQWKCDDFTHRDCMIIPYK